MFRLVEVSQRDQSHLISCIHEWNTVVNITIVYNNLFGSFGSLRKPLQLFFVHVDLSCVLSRSSTDFTMLALSSFTALFLDTFVEYSVSVIMKLDIFL